MAGKKFTNRISPVHGTSNTKETVQQNKVSTENSKQNIPVTDSGTVRTEQILTRSSSQSNHVPVRMSQLELFVSCRNLPSMDSFSNTDPMCVLYFIRYGAWAEQARTEAILDSNNPNFVDTFNITVDGHSPEEMKISVYDTENLTSKELHKHKFIGDVVLNTNSLLDTNRLVLDIKSRDFKHMGVLHLGIERVDASTSKQTVQFLIAGKKLSRKGLFAKVDSFLEIERDVAGILHPIYRSEVIFRSTEPRWRQFQLSLQKLCAGDMEKRIVLQVWYFHNKGNHEKAKQTSTSLHKLLQNSGTVIRLPLHKTSSNGKSDHTAWKKDSLKKSVLLILQCLPKFHYTLFDFIRAGTSIECSIAIDLTYSNGPLSEEHSLHSLTDEPYNEYIKAIRNIGKWMAGFSRKTKTHFFVFGAKNFEKNRNTEEQLLDPTYDGKEIELSPASTQSTDSTQPYCVAYEKSTTENMNSAEHEDCIDIIIDAYREVVQSAEFGGPSYFTPVLESMLSVIDKSKLNFYFFLLVTDGVCNDEIEFKSLLMQQTEQPMILVIAGVGPSDFVPLVHLIRHVNRKSNRSLLFFLPLRDEQYLERNLQQLFANLSKEATRYLLQRSPNMSTVAMPFLSNNNKTKEPANASEQSGIEPHAPNIENKTSQTQHTCPTCGSKV